MSMSPPLETRHHLFQVSARSAIYIFKVKVGRVQFSKTVEKNIFALLTKKLLNTFLKVQALILLIILVAPHNLKNSTYPTVDV